ncbi:MAG: PE-PGRS family protein [Bacteroidota bacterium]
MNNILNWGKWLVLLFFCSFSGCNEPAAPIVSILAEFESAKTVGEINNPEIDEASGLIASRNFAGKLWVHNDSGDKNRLFLINANASYQGSIYLNGVTNRDWEDIAISRFPDNENYLFVADIGDNEASYNNEYYIYKFKEPKSQPVANNDQYINDIQTIKFKYSDGSRDAETLLIDHDTKDLYIVTKRENRIRLYRLAAPQATNTTNTAEFVTELPIGGQLNGVPTGATAGDISPDNTEIIIKSYFQIFYWKLQKGENILKALSRKYDKLLPYSPEPQGEGICLDNQNLGYFTIGESGESKNIVNLYYYKRK